MKDNYLLSHRCATIGWCIFIPMFIVGILRLSDVSFIDDNTISFTTFGMGEAFLGNGFTTSWGKTGMLDEITLCLLLASLFMIAFAKEKQEDEYIEHLRLSSLVWSLRIQTILMIICTWFVFGITFLVLMEVFMISMFIIFILRFKYLLYQSRRSDHEE